MRYIDNRNEFLEEVSKLENTETIYDKDGIVIVKIKSWDDCNTLFDRETIDWCIARSQVHWNDYVGKPFTKQFFIVDFNSINECDNFRKFDNALIGITTTAGEITFAHTRNDYDLVSRSFSKPREWGKMYHPLERILDEKGLYNFVIKNNFSDKRKCSLFMTWLHKITKLFE